MKSLTLFQKINLGLGIVFLVIGVLLFVQKLNATFVITDLSFIFLGTAIMLATNFLAEDKK